MTTIANNNERTYLLNLHNLINNVIGSPTRTIVYLFIFILFYFIVYGNYFSILENYYVGCG